MRYDFLYAEEMLAEVASLTLNPPPPIEVHAWDDLDLRNDLNGVAALTFARDLVISFSTFGAEFAGTLGVPTLCFSSCAWTELCSHNTFQRLASAIWPC